MLKKPKKPKKAERRNSTFNVGFLRLTSDFYVKFFLIKVLHRNKRNNKLKDNNRTI